MYTTLAHLAVQGGNLSGLPPSLLVFILPHRHIKTIAYSGFLALPLMFYIIFLF